MSHLTKTILAQRSHEYRIRKLAKNPHYDADRKLIYRRRHPDKYKAELVRNRERRRRRESQLKDIIIFAMMSKFRTSHGENSATQETS